MARTVDEYLRARGDKTMNWSIYRRKRVVEVTAPSGLTYKIRSIPVSVILRYSNPSSQAEDISIAILESSVLEPKLCRDERPDCIPIDDLPPVDALFLLNEIAKLSDLDKLQELIELPKNK